MSEPQAPNNWQQLNQYQSTQPTQPAFQQPTAFQQPMALQQPGQQYGSPQMPAAADSGSLGWAVLGFFIPLVGLILFLVWKDTKPLSAKKAGIGALVSVIVGAVCTVIGIAIFIGLLYQAVPNF